MSGKKQAQKELKQPDKFQLELMHVADWISKYRRQLLLYAVLPVTIVLVTLVVVKNVREYQADTRNSELSKIDLIYDNEEKAAEKIRSEIQEKITKLSVKPEPEPEADAAAVAVDKAASATATAQPGEVAASPIDAVAAAEQKKKLENELKAVKADHAESLAAYQKFFEANLSNPEGWRAGLRVVNTLVQNKKYQEAATSAENLLKQAKSLDFYQVQVRLLYISILEEQDRFDDALKEIDVLIKAADESLQPRVLLSKGRIEILKNSKDAAKSTFENLIAKHGASAEAQKAKTMMALWN